MKQIVCEVCGSNDLVKEDGCFICQYCGAKYSPEEAKRLIVEVNGKVDVSGSKVTVDNTSFVERSLENARRVLLATQNPKNAKMRNNSELA